MTFYAGDGRDAGRSRRDAHGGRRCFVTPSSKDCATRPGRWSCGSSGWPSTSRCSCRSTRASGAAPSSLQGYIDSLPAAVRAAFLGPGGDFSTPVGYVNTELLSWLAPIVLHRLRRSRSPPARWPARRRAARSASCSRNTVGRRRLVLQKYAAMLVVVGVLGAAFWLSLVIATRDRRDAGRRRRARGGAPAPDAARASPSAASPSRSAGRPGAGRPASRPAPASAWPCIWSTRSR